MNITDLKKERDAQDSISRGEFHQSILDVGYFEWQNGKNNWHYRDMVNWVGEKFGPAAKLLILIGKYNHQVCNGGHRQYHDNGFANGKGCFSHHEPEIPLHKELIQLFRQYKFYLLPRGKELLAILEAFRIEIDDEREITESCGECGGSGRGPDGESGGCEECGGSGQVRAQNDNFGSIVNEDELDALNDRYYAICAEWEKALDAHVKAWFETGVDPLKDAPADNAPAPKERPLSKPRVKLIGENGNAYVIMGLTERALRGAGVPETIVQEYLAKARSGNYDNLLRVTMEYCDVH